MKVAARFPVKNSTGLFVLIIFVHAAILILAWLKFGYSWQTLVSLTGLIVSAYYSLQRYRQLTQAPDDLCWSGENWVIHSDSKLGAIIHLQLLPTSWMSRFACVLHFNAGNLKYSWLFTLNQLGERSYRELCYLVRQNLAAQQKQ